MKKLYQYLSALLICTLQLQSIVPVMAAPVAITDTPLNTGGVDIVRPNIMLLMDDSGSMGLNYVPDYVGSASLCRNTTTVIAGATPGARANSIGDHCLSMSPPFYNSDVNYQYYNPEIVYTPPVKADLSSWPAMDAANTANWTQVYKDRYGIAAALATRTNLVTGYPSYYFCNGVGLNCAHDSNYNFPEITGSMRQNRQNATSAAHYYTLSAQQYCSDEALRDCINSTSAMGIYTYPAKVRFCKDTDYVTCQKLYSQPTGYIIPNYLGNPGAVPTASKATIKISTITASSTAKITSLIIDGHELAGAGLSLNYANTTAAAAGIAADINTAMAGIGYTDFTAASSGDTITLTATTISTTFNGKTISIQGTITSGTAAVWTVLIKNANKTTLSRNNCLNPVGGVAPSSLIGLGSAAVSSIGLTQCNSTTVSAPFNITPFLNSSNYTAAFTPVTGPAAASANDAKFSFSKTTPLGLVDNVSCAINRATSGATTISGSTCSRTTNATQEGAKFSVQGATAGLTSTGTTAGGVDGIFGAGTWQRVTIESSQNAYPKVAARTDCAGVNCTYVEEITNFANWYAYYRTRIQGAKTATGIAFSSLNSNFRVGYSTINNPTAITEVDRFDLVNITKRNAWYNRLYAQGTPGMTPLRAALSDMGRYFAGKLGGTDPVEYSCQKNYTILVTDGYWNDSGGKDIDNNALTLSQDSTLGTYVTRESGVYDGRNAGNTLSDVAQYYYAIDMRTGINDPKAKNNVPTNAKDPNTGQHMNTYTMGLGIDGLMQFKKTYATSGTGDFAKITSGATNCLWESATTNVCNWPIPSAGTESTADDLWHAAINGRGQYFSAKSPIDASEGLKEALSDVVTIAGSAAASATSSPNITQTDNFIYSSTYQTALWDGEIVAQHIDTSNGNVLPTIEWSASSSLNVQADALASTDLVVAATLNTVHPDANSSARTLITLNSAVPASTYDKTKPFAYSSLTATERGWFANHCTNLHLEQCAQLNVPTIRIPFADHAQNMINYLRGANTVAAFNDGTADFGYLDIYRQLRTNRLGDTVNAIPHYVNKPTYLFNYTLPNGYEDYTSFKTRVNARPGALYIGANDGMLHGFDGSTGLELFGYVPRTVMPEMWRLADGSYATKHRYFVDGSPVSMDVTNSVTNQWHTVLVGGYRKGGNGFYALDVTDPTSPKVLWEVCNNATLCPNHTIPNMGLSFSKPIITRLPAGNTNAGRWVVLLSSGYNNEPTNIPSPTASASGSGDGKGHMYVLDVLTGALLETYDTQVGSTTTPSGLGQLSAVASNFYYDGISTLAYGGDLQGNVWRFDLTQPQSAAQALRVQRVVTLTNANSEIQPITTRIEIGGMPNDITHPVLFIGTGQYISVDDIQQAPYGGLTPQEQSIYAIKDPFFGGSGSSMTDSRTNMIKQTVVDTLGVRTTANATSGTAQQQSVPPPVDWAVSNGWYVDLPDTGERVSIDPTLNLGTLIVSTNVVSSALANACEVGGYSWNYQLDYKTGQYIKTATANAAAIKVPNALIVGNVVIRLPNGAMKVITTTATGAKLPFGIALNASSSLGKRISWREIPQ